MSDLPSGNTVTTLRACSKWQVLSVLLALGLTCWLIYGNAINAPFSFDDLAQILKNPYIRITGFSTDIPAQLMKCRNPNRLLAYFSFALNYYFNRYDVAGYHVVNWLIHVINGLLVYLLARRTLRLMNRDLPGGPFLAALLWLVNPVHTQSVTYIVQRMNSLAALLYLASLVFYIRARTIQPQEKSRTNTPGLYFCLSAVSGICALASKEIAVTLPLMIFLYEWFFIRHLEAGFIKKQAPWMLAMIGALALVTFFYLGTNPMERILSTYDKHPFDMKERLLTQPRVIAKYVSLLLLPLPERLNIDHYITVSRTLTNPVTTLPALGLLLITVFTAVARARTNRLFAFAVLWFLGTLAVESSFIGLDLMFEHRTYLPSVFPFIAVTCGLLQYIRPQWLARTTLILLIAVSGFWTWQRNAVWADEVRFWQDAIQKAPQSIRPYNNLGIALAFKGRFQEGIDACLKSIALSSPITDTSNAYTNVCRMYHDLKNNKAAIEYGLRAIQINPDLAEAHLNLGKALLAENRMDEAIEHLKKTIDLSPQLAPAYILLSQATYRKNKDVGQALDICRQALKADPENLNAEIVMVSFLLESGQPEQALFHLRSALKKFPGKFQVNFFAGIIYNRLNQPEQAITHLVSAASARPDDARIPAELETALAAFNRKTMKLVENQSYEKAITAMENLGKLLPSSPTIYYNLACLYARQNQPDKALQQLEKAVEKGFADWETLEADTDLKKIRTTAFFQGLINSREK